MEIQGEDIMLLLRDCRAGDADAAFQRFCGKCGVAAADEAGVRLAVCRVLAEKGHDGDAGDLARHLLRSSPDDMALAAFVAGHFRKSPTHPDETIELLTSYCERHPTRPEGYQYLLHVLTEANRPAEVRKYIALGQRLITDGHLNWQAGAPSRVSASDLGGPGRAAWIDGEVRRLVSAGGAAAAPPVPGTVQTATPAPAPAPAMARTGAAHNIGSDGVAFVGEVGGGAAGTYWFEYGPSPSELSGRTPERPLPGAPTARRRMAMIDAPAYWDIYAAEFDWPKEKAACALVAPFGKDPNHISGVGFLELIGGAYPLQTPDKPLTRWDCIDLTGARVEVDLIPDGLDAKDFHLVLGVQGCRRTEDGARTGEYATWGLTSAPIDFSRLPDGKCTTVRFILGADPSKWTYFGNNPAGVPESEALYRYHPIGRLLERHDDNVFLAGVFGDWRDTMTGRLTIPEIRLAYAGRSLLANPAIAVLTGPRNGVVEPSRICNQDTGASSSGWWTTAPGTRPAHFMWTFRAPRIIRRVVVRNHPLLPSRSITVHLQQANGRSETFQHAFAPGANDAIFDMDAEAIGISLLVAGPEGAAGYGIASAEAYGEAYALRPAALPTPVSDEARDLAPGSSVHYRIVRHDGPETVAGEIESFTLPADNAPLLHGMERRDSAPGRAVFLVRGNAMGRPTVLEWRLDGDAPQSVDFGWERTSAHRAITIRDLAPGTSHRLTCRMTNDAGVSRDLEIDWKQPAR